MKLLLNSEFPNGPFGDPALYIWEVNGKGALLFDCGDLTRLTTRQLLKVHHLFLSHCHMDHFFGFDLFLRVHMGSDKAVNIYGPPETSLRVAGKLQAYTWNLIQDQELSFIVTDLDPKDGKKTLTHFCAKDRFLPTETTTESWDPFHSVLDAGTFHVCTAMLDHRTPSMAYTIEEKETVSVDADPMEKMGLKAGPWINELKRLFFASGLPGSELEVETIQGGKKTLPALELASQILLPRQRHKIGYVTDGGAHPENREVLLRLVEGADVLYHETCFLLEDEDLARQTKHFTAAFVGKLARDAHVKRLVPFHYSKRYLECPNRVPQEIASYFKGEISVLAPHPPQLRL